MTKLTLKLDGTAPQQLPMRRLAGYLGPLSELYGQHDHVTFDSVTDGSADLNALVAEDAYPKVVSRIEQATRGDNESTDPGVKAYNTLARLMHEDDVSGSIHAGECKVIDFPVIEDEPTPLSYEKHGSVQGRLYALGGKDETIPVRLEGANGETLQCETNPAMAINLRPYLFEYVRVHGWGEWKRSPGGHWSLRKLVIDSFQPLDNVDVKEAVRRIRQLNKRESA